MNSEKVKLTPGPWEIERVPIQSSGGSNTCWTIGPFKACIYDDWRQRDRGFSEEDIEYFAKLMSHAPCLLEALQALVDKYMLSADGQEEEWLKARAAIAKALNQPL